MPAGECPYSFSAIQAFGLEFSHSENAWAWQARQLPHAIGKGTTTRSPTERFGTPLPTSTTSPMNSWPRMSPFSIDGTKPLYRCRSDPQIAVEVIRTIASRAFRIWGSGTCSTRTVCLPFQQLALISYLLLLAGRFLLRSHTSLGRTLHRSRYVLLGRWAGRVWM